MWGLGQVQYVTSSVPHDTPHSLLAKNNKMVILQAILAYPGGAPSGPWARRTARDGRWCGTGERALDSETGALDSSLCSVITQGKST